MRVFKVIVVLSFAVAAANSAGAATLKVPADFATIADAVAAAGDGDEIRISKGNYPEFVLIQKSNLTLRAKGKVVLTPPVMFAPIVVDALITLNACSNVTVIGITAKPTIDVRGFHLDSCTDCRIQSCRAEGGQNSLFGANSTNLTVTDCTFEDSDQSSILVMGVSAFITRCHVKNAGDDGIEVDAGEATITHNTVDGAGANCIRGFFGTQVAITDNVVAHGGNSGISCHSDSVVAGNQVKKCENGLIVASNSVDSACFGNSVEKSATNGIEIDPGCSGVQIFENVAKGSGTSDFADANAPGANFVFDNQFGIIGP